jgi:hypothetical protein|tara:strand:+ start:173 stop:346 length:174 start_codon:yes stop_codon:yes gene_type:complete
MDNEIRLLKHALKKGEDDPFMYTNEEVHRLKKKLRQLKNWKRSAQISQNNGFGQYVE